MTSTGRTWSKHEGKQDCRCARNAKNAFTMNTTTMMTVKFSAKAACLKSTDDTRKTT